MRGVLRSTSYLFPSLRQHRAFVTQQFYQIVDVSACGEKAVGVDAQVPPAVQDGRRQPSPSRTLDALLQSALQLILLFRRLLTHPHGKETSAAERRLNLAHTLELLQLVEARGEIANQFNLPVNYLRIAAHAERLERGPDLQSHPAPCSQLAVAEEVILDIRAAALFAQIFGSDVEGVAQHTPSAAHAQRAALEGDEHPLVRVERDRVGALDTAQTPLMFFGERERAAVDRKST